MIDWTKPIQSREGRPARLLGTVHCKDAPFVVAVAGDRMSDGDWHEYLTQCNADGRFHGVTLRPASPLDIVNVEDK